MYQERGEGHKELRVDDIAPWKQRFRAPVILGAQLAKATPTRGLVTSNTSGVYQLYAWDVPTGALTLLTNRPAGTLFGAISPDGRYVYYLDDRHRNEIGHYVRVPFTGGTPQDLTPDLLAYSPIHLTVSHASNHLGFTVADAAGFHLYCIDLGPAGTLGTRRLLYQCSRLTFGPLFSHGGDIAVLASTERTGKLQYSLLAFDTVSGEQIGELWDGPGSSVEPHAFSPLAKDCRLLATTNCTGTRRPVIWNPRTGEREELGLADLEGEVVPWNWSYDGERILLCQFTHAVQQLYTYRLPSQTLTRLHHPQGTFCDAYFLPDGVIFAQWQDATHPPQLIALNGDTGVQTHTLLAAGTVPPGHSWRAVTFMASDGLEIQGWLGLPDGTGPFPTILEMHGGPHAVRTEIFSWASQMWLDHGFAFLSINYRGSTTFGRAFEEQIWGHPGHGEVEDIVAARHWLVQQGIAQPERMLLTGWSYGGYLTLLALGTHPHLWAGGMAGIAVADRAMQYQDASASHKAWLVNLFGGTPEEKPDQYTASSPVTYVDCVQAPVLVIQGRNDSRCPSRQLEAYEQKMRALGKSIEVDWFDAGHGSLRVEQQIAQHERMLHFAYRIVSSL